MINQEMNENFKRGDLQEFKQQYCINTECFTYLIKTEARDDNFFLNFI